MHNKFFNGGWGVIFREVAIIVRGVISFLMGGGNWQEGCNFFQGRNKLFKWGGGVIFREVAIVVRGVPSFLMRGV